MPTDFIRSRVVHFDPAKSGTNNIELEYLEDAIVCVRDGKIQELLPTQQALDLGLDTDAISDKSHCLMMPGFIDAHVHAPQLRMIGSYGEKLLQWLEKYTFPNELRFADHEYSKHQSAEFVDTLLAHGTTSACVFTTTFSHSTEHLFEYADRLNMRLIAGKVLMDRNAPKGLLDQGTGVNETLELIEKYHKRGRLGYAITPRFSGTSTPNQLQAAGDLLKDFPDLWIQTHLSENLDEVAWTKGLFPDTQDYLGTYEEYGLHTEQSIFAHCIHLSESELDRIAKTGSTIAFCPSSNMFLGSGLLNLTELHDRGIHYALATDVGAGTSLSIFKTLGDAYKVSQLSGYPLSAKEAFYSATLGSARALKLETEIGSLSQGKAADFILINPALHNDVSKRLHPDCDIEEELFVYMTMGDDRLLEHTYISGNCVYSNPLCKEQIH